MGLNFNRIRFEKVTNESDGTEVNWNSITSEERVRLLVDTIISEVSIGSYQGTPERYLLDECEGTLFEKHQHFTDKLIERMKQWQESYIENNVGNDEDRQKLRELSKEQFTY